MGLPPHRSTDIPFGPEKSYLETKGWIGTAALTNGATPTTRKATPSEEKNAAADDSFHDDALHGELHRPLVQLLISDSSAIIILIFECHAGFGTARFTKGTSAVPEINSLLFMGKPIISRLCFHKVNKIHQAGIIKSKCSRMLRVSAQKKCIEGPLTQ